MLGFPRGMCRAVLSKVSLVLSATAINSARYCLAPAVVELGARLKLTKPSKALTTEVGLAF